MKTWTVWEPHGSKASRKALRVLFSKASRVFAQVIRLCADFVTCLLLQTFPVTSTCYYTHTSVDYLIARTVAVF